MGVWSPQHWVPLRRACGDLLGSLHCRSLCHWGLGLSPALDCVAAPVLPGAWPLRVTVWWPLPWPQPSGHGCAGGLLTDSEYSLYSQGELGLQQAGWDLDPFALNGAWFSACLPRQWELLRLESLHAARHVAVGPSLYLCPQFIVTPRGYYCPHVINNDPEVAPRD